MTIKIIIAESATDYERALSIRKEVFILEQKVPASLELDEFEKSSTHFLALAEGEAVGAGRLRLKGPFAKFERIATLASQRGLGVGKRLVEFMQAHAAQKYPKHLPAMHAQQSAIGFYEKLGWMGLGEIFNEAGIPHRLLIFPPESVANIQDLLIWEEPKANEVIQDFLRGKLRSP